MADILYTNNLHTVLKSGTYVFGDPCYSFSHSTTTWQEFCNQADFSKDILFVKANNKQAVMCSTAFGDGMFDTWISKEISKKSHCTLPVDAGMLGFVLVSDVEYNSTYQKNNKVGQVVTLKEDCYLLNDNGIIRLYTISEDTLVLSVDTR